jgi:hypothetical protein
MLSAAPLDCAAAAKEIAVSASAPTAMIAAFRFIEAFVMPP